MNENEGLYLNLKTFKTPFSGLYGNKDKYIKTLIFFITSSSYILKVGDNIFLSSEHAINDIKDYYPIAKVDKESKNKEFILKSPIHQTNLPPFKKNIDIINNKLWLVINSDKEEMAKMKNKDIKQENKKTFDENEKQNEEYYLNENDVIKFGNVIYIVKEIHLRNGKNEKDNNYNIHKLNNSMIKKAIFNSCYQNNIILNSDDYKYCEHIKSYLSFGNKSEKFNKIKDFIKKNMPKPVENKSKTAKTYKLTLYNCENCNKECNKEQNIIYPLIFKTSENNETFELIDIEKDESKDYIILESLEEISKPPIIKYIHYIELKGNENEEYIEIGRNHEVNDVINFDETMSRSHAYIKYNKNDRTLILKNISESSTTSVLLRFSQLKILKNKEIYLQSGNTLLTIKIMAKEMYDEIEKEFNKKIAEEKEKENKKLEEEKIKYNNGEYNKNSY